MRILRVTSSLYPNKVGGIGVHAHEMSKEQARFGHNVTVYTSNVDRKLKQEFKSGYEIIRYNTTLKLIGNSFMPMLFFKLIRTRNVFDIIHAHSHLFFSTNLCALVRRLGSSPLVITNHGIMSASAPDWFSMLYMKTIGKWTLKSADKIICYTQMEKDKLVDMLKINRDKITVIPNGVDVDLFYPDTNEHRNSSNTLLWVGRFVRGKGVKYIIQAAKMLVKEIPDLNILLVGDGPLKGEIESLIEKFNLKKNVTIKENVPNENMPEVYRKSDIFVLPSLNEGVPRTMLEAMSCNIPIVCTELPQLVDVMKECGLLVPVRDSQALAEAISKIISDESLAQKLGENGRKKVVENYSWEDTVKKTIQLYRELI